MATRRLELVFTGDSRQLERTFGRVASSSKSVESAAGRSVRALGKMTAAAGAAGIALAGAFGGLGVKEAIEQEKVAARTANVLRTTGGVANVTKKEIEGLSSALQDQTGVADDAIQSSQNLLLTFTNVRNEAGKGNDVFTRTTKAALDMSVALGTDLQGSTMQLGKALNDPIKGITALSRAGVSFTAQQKEQIRTLVESGRTLDAQKIILAEVNKEFGGAAAAAGNTTAGQFEKLKRTVENAAESFAVGLLPVLTKVTMFSRTEVVPRVMEVVTTFQREWPRIREVVVSVVGAVVGFIRDHWGTISAVTVSAWRTVLAAVRGTVEWIDKNVVPTIRAVVTYAQAFWDRFGSTITATFTLVVQVVRRALNVMRGVIEVVLALIRGDWGAAWNGVKRIVTNTLGALVDVIRGIGPIIGRAMRALGKLALDALGAALRGVAGAVRSALVSGFRALGDLPGFLIQKGKELGGRIVDGIVEAIKGAAGRIAGAVKDSITGGLGGLGGTVLSALGFASGGFIPGRYRGVDDRIAAVASGEAILTPRQQDMVPGGRATLARIFRSTGGRVGGSSFVNGGVVGAAAFAASQKGKPYQSPPSPPARWDCSSFAGAAARAAGSSAVGTYTGSLVHEITPVRGGEPIIFGFRPYGSPGSYDGGGDEHMGIKIGGVWWESGGRGNSAVGPGKSTDRDWKILGVPKGLERLADGGATGANDPPGMGGRTQPELSPFQAARNVFRAAGIGAKGAAATARAVLTGTGARTTGVSDRVAGGSLRTNEQRQVEGAGRTARRKARAAGKSPEEVTAAGDRAERAATAKWYRLHIRQIDTERRKLKKRKADLLKRLAKLPGKKNDPDRKKAARQINLAVRTIEAELRELLALRAEANDALKAMDEQEEADAYEADYVAPEEPPEPPSESDFIDAAIAEAALTPGLDDDVAAAEARERLAQREYDAAKASGDPRRIADTARELASAREATAQVRALRDNTDAVTANTEAIQRTFGGSVAFGYRGQDYVLRSLAPPSSDRLDSSLLGV